MNAWWFLPSTIGGFPNNKIQQNQFPRHPSKNPEEIYVTTTHTSNTVLRGSVWISRVSEWFPKTAHFVHPPKDLATQRSDHEGRGSVASCRGEGCQVQGSSSSSKNTKFKWEMKETLVDHLLLLWNNFLQNSSEQLASLSDHSDQWRNNLVVLVMEGVKSYPAILRLRDFKLAMEKDPVIKQPGFHGWFGDWCFGI